MINRPLSITPINTAPKAQWYEYRSIGSTMDCGRMLHYSGDLVHGSIVSARYQRYGRGQTMQRKWSAPNNTSVLMTLIVDRAYCAPTALSLRVGLGLMRYLEHTYSLQSQMRWPNDIMINDKKVAGILTQQERGVWLIGIGLNCRQSRRWCSRLDAISLRTAIADLTTAGGDSLSDGETVLGGDTVSGTSVRLQQQPQHQLYRPQPQQLLRHQHRQQQHRNIQQRSSDTIMPNQHIVPLAKTILDTLLFDQWHSAASRSLWKKNKQVLVSTNSNLDAVSHLTSGDDSYSISNRIPHTTSFHTVNTVSSFTSSTTTRTNLKSTSNLNRNRFTATVCGIASDGALLVRHTPNSDTDGATIEQHAPSGIGDELTKLYSGSIR